MEGQSLARNCKLKQRANASGRRRISVEALWAGLWEYAQVVIKSQPSLRKSSFLLGVEQLEG
jgi:hypothetical protein